MKHFPSQPVTSAFNGFAMSDFAPDHCAPGNQPRIQQALNLGDGYRRAPAASSHALRAVTLFGERFPRDDGTVLVLLTRRSCERMREVLGLTQAEVLKRMHGTFVLTRASGTVITSGRRVRETTEHSVAA